MLCRLDELNAIAIPGIADAFRDAALVRAAQTGDITGLGVLLERYRAAVWRGG